MIDVHNMETTKGYPVRNQIVIKTDKGKYFKSYETVIAFIPNSKNKKVLLDKHYWDYSQTTGKYRNIFLNETKKKETEAKIKNGTYKLVENINIE